MNIRTPSLQYFIGRGSLSLLGAVCILGIGTLDGVSENRLPSECEEAKELTGADDVDDLDGTLNHELTLIHGHCFDKWLHTEQDSPLLRHSWRWCSRGPPTA